MSLLRLILIVGCLSIFGAAHGFADDDFEHIREKIVAALESEQIPSLAVAVARDGEVLWEQGFGWADRERRREATEHTMYSLASISKPITATAIMMLVEDGELDLDMAANSYLADAKLVAHVGESGEATIRRLANHTSGLPLHCQFFYEDENYPRPPFAESLRRYGVLMTPPGERFQYANFGYGVLDHLIGRRSGQRYADFVREGLFLPLGMLHTSVDIGAGLEPFAAMRYAADQSPLPHYGFDHPGASAVYSSAHDLLRFGIFHLGQTQPEHPRILSNHSIQAMQVPTAKVSGSRHYGIGWFVDTDERGLHTVSHSGGMGGVRTRLTIVPDKKIAVVALCNYRTDLPMRITREVLATLLPDNAVPLRKAVAHEPKSQPPTPRCPPELVGYWAGDVATYQGHRRLEFWAHPDGDIHARLAGGLKTLVNDSHLKDGVLTGELSGDIGTTDANRRPYHLHLRLKMRGDVMNGYVSAISRPSRKAGNALSYWAEVTRADEDPRVRPLFNGQNLSGWRVLDKYDFERHGAVRVEDQTIVLGAGSPATGISWQGGLLRYDYELSLDAQRQSGSDFFCGITFPVGEKYLSLIIGGWGGGVTGVSNLDGMSAVENETTGYREFQQGKWYGVRLRVTKDAVQAWVDDKQIVDVDLKGRSLSIWWEQELARPLGIASWYTRSALKNIRIKRLTE